MKIFIINLYDSRIKLTIFSLKINSANWLLIADGVTGKVVRKLISYLSENGPKVISCGNFGERRATKTCVGRIRGCIDRWLQQLLTRQGRRSRRSEPLKRLI
jgi:hypothetical protein